MTLTTQNNQLPTKFEDVAQFAVLAQEKLKSVKAEINAIKRLGLARDVYEQKKAEAQELAELTVRAEVKLGEITSNMPTAQGARTDLTSLPQGKEVVTKQAALKGANINAKRASHYEAMAAHPEIVEAAITEARENDDIVSRSFVLEKIKAKAQQVKTEAVKADIERQREEIASQPLTSPDGLFDVIAIDPPWNYGTQYDAGGRRVGNPYPEMTQSELLNMKVPSADNAIMFLWTTQRFIWDAKELLSAWGFEYRNVIVWDKQSIGMGDLFRMQCEFCLVGIKGKPTIDNNHAHRDIIQEQRREHSRKPDAFYKMVDELCVGRKLDFFSRQQRDGWVTFGNETNKF
jgi:N6-adenosine-specific RNA methylase IME4